jgi:hypothetical protein
MSPALKFWAKKPDYNDMQEEWSRDKKRRTLSEYSPPPPKREPVLWETNTCDAEPIPSTREQSAALNSEIDDIYGQLGSLVAKRHAGQLDTGLESQIAQLFQRLRILQKQEADLIRAMIPSARTSNVETGLEILRRVEQLRIKYGDPATTNSTTDGSNTTQA